MWGERISCGSGVARRVGRCSWRMRRAVFIEISIVPIQEVEQFFEHRQGEPTLPEVEGPLVRRLAIVSTALFWCSSWTGGREPDVGEDFTPGLDLREGAAWREECGA